MSPKPTFTGKVESKKELKVKFQVPAASTSAPTCVPKHSFNLRPNRAQRRAERQGDGFQSQCSVRTRGPNTSHKLKPDAEKGEKTWNLYLNNRDCPIGERIMSLSPNQPLSHHIVYRGMKSQLQERVRYNRCQVKQEYLEVWKNTPEAEREALWTTPTFSWIDRDS
ncbi:uncharacterized protein A4U43_C10F9040 [Asparagus officinalis]|uniref:Uncharacterized protein n=1 Tax=Asparagus officinalis TaxID=4686 RepID=A0A5P1E213_ASPOF|nr:uncharacterized protein A4U43_C10F9040 [Asparagus officinalis]